MLALLSCSTACLREPAAPATSTAPATASTAAPSSITPPPTTEVAPTPPPTTRVELPLPPDATTPIGCGALGASVPVYEGALEGDRLRLTALLSGPTPEFDGRTPLTLRAERVDLDGDGADDVLGTWIDANGEPDCGNWGECVMGVFVHCETGWASVVPLDYTLGLRAGTTRTEYGGRRFRVVLLDERAGDPDVEADGRGFWSTVLAMDTGGYAGSTRDPWFESERCAAFVREGQLVRARDMCEQGLAAHERGHVRGALYFDLGRIDEAEGHLADARESYRRSLEARPGNATVEARLAALRE